MIVVEVAKYLAENVTGLVWDAVGTTGNVFVGIMPDNPDAAVLVKGSGGLENDTKLPYDSPTVQVIVRGGTLNDHTAGYGTAREIYSTLHGKTSTDLPDGTRLVLARGIQSEPADIGFDENGRQEWSLNFVLEVRAPTENRS